MSVGRGRNRVGRGSCVEWFVIVLFGVIGFLGGVVECFVFGGV